MKSHQYYDCWELERELKKLGWSGDLLEILEPSCNGDLVILSLNKEDLRKEDWVDEDDDVGCREYEARKNLVAYVKQLDIQEDENGHIAIQAWW